MHTFSWHLYKNDNLKNHLGTSLVAQWLQISSHYYCSFNGSSLFWHDRKVCWKSCFSEAISQNYLRGCLPGYRPHFGSNKLFSIPFIDCLLIIFVDNSEELTHLLFPGTLPPPCSPSHCQAWLSSTSFPTDLNMRNRPSLHGLLCSCPSSSLPHRCTARKRGLLSLTFHSPCSPLIWISFLFLYQNGIHQISKDLLQSIIPTRISSPWTYLLPPSRSTLLWLPRWHVLPPPWLFSWLSLLSQPNMLRLLKVQV